MIGADIERGDLVAGSQWPELLEVLSRGGRYVVSGAIAGPIDRKCANQAYSGHLTVKAKAMNRSISV